MHSLRNSIRNLVQTRVFWGEGPQSKAEIILRVLVERISGSDRGQSAKKGSERQERRLVSSRADRKKSFNEGSLFMGGKSFNGGGYSFHGFPVDKGHECIFIQNISV